MRTPKHFPDSKRFTEYILECAIRDRETFIIAITPNFGEPDEETAKIIEENEAEIRAMKCRLKIVKNR